MAGRDKDVLFLVVLLSVIMGAFLAYFVISLLTQGVAPG
jgi:hypothetical protein